MDFLTGLAGTGLPLHPRDHVDIDGLSLPERTLLPEWATEHYRQKSEAIKEAQKAGKNKGKGG